MQNLTIEKMPQAIMQMAKHLELLESLVREGTEAKSKDTSKKKYTLPEAAKYCGMAEPTFRTYIYRRKVAGTKFGKAWLFLEADLDKFIQDFRKPTAKELEKEAFDNLTNGRV